jgi:hypothetical protein
MRETTNNGEGERMKQAHGGHFGARSFTHCVKFLASLSKDYTLQQMKNGMYIFTDTYRPGAEWYGKTPAEACRNGGIIVFKNV